MPCGLKYTCALSVVGALALSVGCGGEDGREPRDPDGLTVAPPDEADAAVDAGDTAPGSAVDGSVEGDAAEPDAGTVVDAGDDGAVADAATEEPEMCPAAAPTSCPDGSPGYAAVKPIIEARCVTCHSPRWTGPWPLDTIGHLRDWFDDVRVNLINCTMPPRDSGVKLTNAERRALMQWVRCGMPD